MKKNITLLFTVLSSIILLSSCKKEDGPSIDDHPLNYTIPVIPATSDIPVGAYIYNTSNAFDDNLRWTRIYEPYDVSTGKIGPYVKPQLDKYALGNTASGVMSMSKIVDWAKQAKIDFLISPSVKENANVGYPGNLNGADSLLLNQLGERSGNFGSVKMEHLKYAIAVDINNFSAGLNNNVLLEMAPVITIGGVSLTRAERLYNFMKRLADYFSDATYYHTDGRPVLVFTGADKLYTADSKKVYDTIRQTIKTHTGKDVYIIARQNQWTPSARFEYFFLQGHVDAVTMDNMCNVGGGMWDRTYLLNRFINENFKLNKAYLQEHSGIDFIPSVSPSFSQYITSGATPDYNYPVIHKDEADFKERCNVAKMNLGTKKMVLVESFNNWAYDSQIEPTLQGYGKDYGTKYLDIVRDEFKVK